MSRSPEPAFLLINPPGPFPAAPPAHMPQVSAWLATSGAMVEQYDACLELYLKGLLSPAFAAGLAQRVRERLARGDYRGQDRETVYLLAQTVKSAGRFGGDLAWLSELAPALRDPGRFYDPAALASALEDLDGILMLASVAYSPLVLDRDGLYGEPASATDPLPDPLRELWERALALKLARPGLVGAAVLCPGPASLTGAVLLAETVKRLAPDLPLCLLWAGEAAGQEPRGLFDRVEALASFQDPTELAAALLPGLAQGPAHPSGPHLGGLEVVDYPAPAPVLPLCLDGGLSGPPGLGMPPEEAATLAAELAARYEAGGLILADCPPWPWLLNFGRALPQFHFLPPLAVTLPLGPAHQPDDLSLLANSGVILARWLPQGNWDEGARKNAAAGLRAAAKAGLWNHVCLGPRPPGELVDFCRENPNLAHSVDPPPPLECLPVAAPEAAPGCPALAGEPLWKHLRSLPWQLLYLAHVPAKRLWRTRLDPEDNSPWVVGDALSFHFAKPEEVGEERLGQMERLVLAGGAVGPEFLRGNLDRAHLLGWAEERGVMVGVEVLKNPRPEFVARMREKTGLDLAGFVERGYISVLPQYRGLGVGTKLAEGLTARRGDKKIYVITEESNLAPQHVGRRNDTRLVAKYFSEKKGATMCLAMPGFQLEGQDLEGAPA